MSTQVTINLPDEVYRRAERFAKLTGRDVADVLATMIEISLPSVGSKMYTAQSMQALSDEKVLALSESQMDVEQDKRLSDLLYKQQAGNLEEGERLELQALMQVYQESLLRKAQALAEAVRRRLRAPLES